MILDYELMLISISGSRTAADIPVLSTTVQKFLNCYR
jgi:hypothetical protein